MRELCQIHKLAIAPDGKCVLCRRPSLRLFAVREEHETIISRVFTGLLGVCLAAAASALVYMSMLDAGYTGGKYVAGPPLAKLSLPAPVPAETAQDDASTAARSTPPALARPEPGSRVTADEPDPGAAATADGAPTVMLQPVAVTMYATPWCDICDRAREFLLARDVVLTEYDIDRDRSAERRLATINPGVSVPTFEIGGRPFVGFNPWDLQDAIRAAATAKVASTATVPQTRAR
jgi:glutaredoxin